MENHRGRTETPNKPKIDCFVPLALIIIIYLPYAYSVYELKVMSESVKRKNWGALWSGVWGGIILIAFSYMLWQKLLERDISEPKFWQEFGQQFLPIFFVLIGILVIGSGIIQWYLGPSKGEAETCFRS